MTIEIVLDTETTGFEPSEGHKLVEIGCVELENHVPTGRHLQLYINPEREIPPDATAIHGITDEFVADKPTFLACYTDFIDFIGENKLVIHNAEFDMKFINHELQHVGHPPLPWSRAIDTLQMARRKFPGSPANLDALCRRFGIDNTERTYHGALLDSELLAEVYLELLGGRQHGLSLARDEMKTQGQTQSKVERKFREPRSHVPNAEELTAHAELLEKLDDAAWTKSA